ncbi:MAG: YfcC family protein [Coprococcus sp.]|nr:YfcC family protein [Coprococcus sp.]
MSKKKFKMPSAMILLFMVLVFVAILTWFVPTSVMTADENGENVIYYNASFDAEGGVVEDAGTAPAGIWDVFMAPIKGFANGADVNFSILISGAFLALMNFAGALDAGVGALLKKLNGKKLLAVLLLVFALMGTVYGSWEELPPYALVLIPLCVTAGYDVLTGIFVLFGGAVIGNMASVVNPYSTGAAVAAIGNPELSLGTGIGMRILLFAALYAIGAVLIIRYAERVKADKTKSALYSLDNINTLSAKSDMTEFPELTKKRIWSLIVFGIMILVIVLGYIPWGSITAGDQTMYEVVNAPSVWLMEHAPVVGNLLGADSFTWLADWYFDEFSIVFLIGSVVVAFINKISMDDFVSEFVRGASELVSLTLVISISRGISLIMGDSSYGMSITFVYWIRNALASIPAWGFAVGAIVLFVIAALFIQSTSGMAGMTMPILGAVTMALFAGTTIGTEGGQMMLVSAFTVGLNFMASGLYPDATKMGVLEITNVPYPVYLKEVMKIMVPLLVVSAIVIMVSPYLGLV